MLGLAIGDALGITTESWLPSERQAEHGEIRDYIPNKYVDVPIGFPSDDTPVGVLDPGANAGGQRLPSRECGGPLLPPQDFRTGIDRPRISPPP